MSGTASLGLWSRWSPVRVRSLTPQKPRSGGVLCSRGRRRRDARPGADRAAGRCSPTAPVAQDEQCEDRHGAADDHGREPEA